MTTALPEPTYRRFVAGLGTLSLRPFDLTEDVTTLHGWVTQPYAQYWGLLNASINRFRSLVPVGRSESAYEPREKLYF